MNVGRIQEKLYVFYRKTKACFYSVWYYVFRLCPFQRNQIVFSNFEGKKGYGDNPKAIAEYIHAKYGEDRYKLVWLANDRNAEMPAYIKVVENTYLKRAYYLTTSGVWIDNHRKSFEVRKRRCQLYIATWHGMIGFKKVGALRGAELPRIAELVSRHDSEMADYFLSNSGWCTETIRKAFFFEGEILKTGSPRCDICMNGDENYRQSILRKYGLDQEVRYFLYAPTFRGYNQKVKMEVHEREIALDASCISRSLAEKFGGIWKGLYRSHPGVQNRAAQSEGARDEFSDISKIEDLYEILPCVDFFISDFSSCVFDAASMKLPVFLFADDIVEYGDKRGILWDLNDLPFPIAQNEKELLQAIEEFDANQYKLGLERLFEKVDLLEDGNASKRVVEKIDSWLDEIS